MTSLTQFVSPFDSSTLTTTRTACKIKTQIKTLAEVRQEAVQQALAALKNRPKPSLPMPSKRSSVFNRSPERGDENDSGNCSSTHLSAKFRCSIRSFILTIAFFRFYLRRVQSRRSSNSRPRCRLQSSPRPHRVNSRTNETAIVVTKSRRVEERVRSSAECAEWTASIRHFQCWFTASAWEKSCAIRIWLCNGYERPEFG